MHIYRWDLDRTYLDTDIHSVRGLIRTAMETAEEKRTVPGAPALLRGLVDHNPTARVAILSGSPTQMREVLQEKLALDGIRVDSLVLKDNLRNLRRGRFRAIRGQLGYKLPQLLSLRLGHPHDAQETLFGDDSEVDALAYTLYADAISGRIEEPELRRIMRLGDAYQDQIDHAIRSLRRIPKNDAVEDVFIHVGRGLQLDAFDALGALVVPVFSWFQAALVLVHRGRLPSTAAEAVVRACRARGSGHPRAFVGLAQDVVRRGLCPAEVVTEVFEHNESLTAEADTLARAIELLRDWRRPRPARDSRAYEAFLASVNR